MNVFTQFEAHIRSIASNFGLDIEDVSLFDRINAEPPRDPSHGDIATNAAMVLAKPAKQNPRVIAEQIKSGLEQVDGIDEVTIAGPGFINLRLSNAFWYAHLREILDAGGDYGRGLVSNGERVNVEYVSANPTGPMHVGHCRGAVVGDTLANLLSFAGFDVVKEYYVNDAGSQIDVLAKSLLLRYREALGEDIGAIPEGLYPGDYLVPVARKLADEKGDSLLSLSEAEQLSILKDVAIAAMMDLIKSDLAALNVHQDVFFSENSLHQSDGENSPIDRMVAEMRELGYVYEGRLPPPKGELPDDWEDREQTLFRSTEVGDDTDRALKKSDGSYTYFAPDIAYFKDKFDRGFTRMVYVLGADHSGYEKRLKAVAKAIAQDKARLDVIFCQLVKLLRAGEPVKMSKRAGNFVTLRDVVDEVGKDAVRFMMLYRKAEAPLEFDFAKVTEQSKDNPVFYVQYAHARICSVLRQVSEEMPNLDTGPSALAGADLTKLSDAGELALIRKAAEFPRVIDQSARADEPHRLVFYLYELASQLHVHWTRGKESPELRFINHADAESTLSRLALLNSLAIVIRSGLQITGVDAPEEMR